MAKNWDEDSGIIVINKADRHAVEWIRFWNLAEPFAVYALFLWTVWSSYLDTSLTWIYYAFGSQFFYLAFVSPTLHYFVEKNYLLRPYQRSIWFYLLDARGIGSPRRFFRPVGERPAGVRKYRKEVIATLAGIGLLFVAAVFAFQSSIACILGIPKGRVWEVSAWGLPLLALLVFVLLPVIVRWDNYRDGFISCIKVTGFGIVVIFIANFFFQAFPDLPFLTETSAREKWSRFSLVTLGGQFGGYLAWGLAYQFFFLSLFNTSFARAFDVRKKKGAYSAAFCTALFMGLIYLPNIWLFTITLIVGFAWSFYFMKTRNLLSMALSHALLAFLIKQLLPVSLSLGIKAYSGPMPLYFIAKGGIFLILPLCFGFFSFFQGSLIKPVKFVSTIAFAVFIFLLYPNSEQGPYFYWGKGGNGKTWQWTHHIVLKRQGEDFTQYLTTGTDGFIVSQPLYVSPSKGMTALIDMAVVPFSGRDRSAVYFDTGNGFNKNDRYVFRLKKGRAVYKIPFKSSGNLLRLRLDPSREKGSIVKLYSLKMREG